MTEDKEQVSELIDYVLRQSPLELDLTMTKDGWVKTSDLVERLRVRKGIEFPISSLEELVNNDPEKRFVLRDDGFICANLGNVIQDTSAIEATSRMPPEVLYHGTTGERWVKIQKDKEISKMKRHHVHLFEDYEAALVLAEEHQKETSIVLKIDSFQMFLEHFEFYIANNGVWLVHRVPVEYITVAVHEREKALL